MTFLSILNAAGILVPALYIIYTAAGRVRMADRREVQWKYVASLVLAACWAGACLLAMVGGEAPDWYQPLGLMAIALDLLNTRDAWRHGPPPSIRREAFIRRNVMRPIRVFQNLRYQNGLTIVALVGTVAVSAGGAVDGRGNPLLIFSAYADPIVANPESSLDIVYSLRRVRVCSGYVDRFILDAKGEDVVQRFESQPIGSTRPAAGKTTARLRILLDDLPAGKYIFRAVVYSACPDGNYVQQSPDVPFMVAPAPDVLPTVAALPPEPVRPITPGDIAPAAAVTVPAVSPPARRAPLAPPVRPAPKPEPAAPLPDLSAAVREANRRIGEGAR
jgi:hypothetical protein